MAADGSTQGDGERRPSAHRDGGRLRPATLADGQPRFPWWLPLPGVALAAVWAAYQGVTGGGAILEALLWPGGGIFVVTTLTTYLGWRLDLD